MKKYDVIILGGGVAGLSIAAWLNKEHIPTVVIDNSRESNQTCTTAINPRSLYYLEQVGALQFIDDYDSYTKIEGTKTYAYNGAVCNGYYEHNLHYPKYGHCFPRSILNDALLKLVKQFKYVDYLAPCMISELVTDIDNDIVKLTGVFENKQIDLMAKVVIDAMGRNSFIAKENNLFSPLPEHKRYVIYAQFEMVQLKENLFHIGVNESIMPGYYTIFPITNNRVILAVFLDAPEVNPEKFIMQFIMNESFSLSFLFKSARLCSPVIAVGPLAYTSTTYALEKILLIGDSTGFFDPLTGEGITQAFITGEIAAEITASYLKTSNWQTHATLYQKKIEDYKRYTVDYAKKLQQFIRYPNAFNRLVESLSQNQNAANWQSCIVGNIYPYEDRTSSNLLKHLNWQE